MQKPIKLFFQDSYATLKFVFDIGCRVCKSIVVMFLFKNIANVYQNVFTDTEEGVD